MLLSSGWPDNGAGNDCDASGIATPAAADDEADDATALTATSAAKTAAAMEPLNVLPAPLPMVPPHLDTVGRVGANGSVVVVVTVPPPSVLCAPGPPASKPVGSGPLSVVPQVSIAELAMLNRASGFSEGSGGNLSLGLFEFKTLDDS